MENIKQKMSVGHFFLSLGVIITLITSVVSFLQLVFATLDKKFPDVLNATYQYGYNTYDYESIRTALSTLIIFFPVFLIISYFWKKEYAKGFGHIDELIRKWLIYLVLFLSAIVIVVDLVTLVKYFVAGEITDRFIYKVLAALITALVVGYYYVLELKSEDRKIIKHILADLAVLMVIGAIAYSFMVMGSPFKQRQLRLDDRRIGDLQNIQYQIINYWQQKEKLPEKLADLANPLSGNSLPVDPEFEQGKIYEYNKKAELTFELCATFLLPIPKGWIEYQNYDKGVIRPMMPVAMEGGDVATSVAYPYPGPGGGTNESWDHQAGRTCFERTIDKDLYPPYPKPMMY